MVEHPVHGVDVLRILQQAGGRQRRVVRLPQLRRVHHVGVDEHVDVRTPRRVRAVQVARVGELENEVPRRVEVGELNGGSDQLRQNDRADLCSRGRR